MQQWANQNAASSQCFGFTGMARTALTALVVLYSQAVLSLWYINLEHGGSFLTFAQEELGHGLVHDTVRAMTVGLMWPSAISDTAMTFLSFFFACSIALMRLLPGPAITGPVTPTGHTPRYVDNGVTAVFVHMLAFLAGSACGLYPLTVVYDELGSILNALNYGALALVVALWLKAKVCPSTADVSSYGNVMLDMFWGCELYPRVAGVDIKQLTNCRFGMVYWAVATVSCLFKAEALTGWVPLTILVSGVLQYIYILKFFQWEAGYLSSMDIAQDHAGYYLCWGCLVYVPTMYTSMTVFFVQNSDYLEGHGGWALLILAFGLLSIWLNYDMDEQRARFRRTNGAAKVWGSSPQYIIAKYTTADGEPRRSLLLLSGYWGMARHFHYVPEIAAAFAWSCTAGFSHALPFLYVIYLTILLVNRAERDDARCKAKYGLYWDHYCARVPWKIVPFIY